MCLAIPARITRITGDGLAVVESGGIEKTISTVMIENPSVGDWVIVHVGYALNRLDEREARETLDLMRSVGLGGI